MTFNRQKRGSRPLRNYDALPQATPEAPEKSAFAPELGAQAVRATTHQHEPMTTERVVDANLIPKAITESEWGPGNAREIDQSHGPSL